MANDQLNAWQVENSNALATGQRVIWHPVQIFDVLLASLLLPDVLCMTGQMQRRASLVNSSVVHDWSKPKKSCC